MDRTTSSDARGGSGSAGGSAARAPSPHETSAGRIRVAIWAGGPTATDRASTASAASRSVAGQVRTQVETFRATVSMSDWSWASYCVWWVAWSPMMLTMGTFALRALWRLARPLPRPQPRCRSVAAGLSAMRAYPSAAPVATPSNRQRTARMSVPSSAATKCISDVPGLVKQVSTPASISVSRRALAPLVISSASGLEGTLRGRAQGARRPPTLPSRAPTPPVSDRWARWVVRRNGRGSRPGSRACAGRWSRRGSPPGSSGARDPCRSGTGPGRGAR